MIRSGCGRSVLAIVHVSGPPRQLRMQSISDLRSMIAPGISRSRPSEFSPIRAWQRRDPTSRDWTVQIRAFAFDVDQLAVTYPQLAHPPDAFDYHQLYSQVNSLESLKKTDPHAAMEEAEKLIKQTRSQNVKLDLANYAALVQLFDECGDLERGINAVALSSTDVLMLIDELEYRELKPHPIVLTSFLTTFMVENHQEGFKRATKLAAQLGLVTRSIEVLNSCISGAIQFQDPFVGLYMFDKSQETYKFSPNKETLKGLMTVCTMMGLSRRAVKFIDLFKRRWNVKGDADTYAQLLRLVLKDNWPEGFFKAMTAFWSAEINPTQEIWNLLVLGTSTHGTIDSAMSTLDAMRSQGVRPDRTTLTSLLTACARKKDFDNALQAFRVIHDDGVDIEANDCGLLLNLAAETNKKDKIDEAIRIVTDSRCAADNEALANQIASLRQKAGNGKSEAKPV